MHILERIIFVSEWATWRFFGRKHMTLSALAQETTRYGGDPCWSRAIDRLFWFDPHHCENAYLQYRLDRLNRERKKNA